jgi:hypothetical protein
VTSKAREIHDRLKAQAAAELATAEREAIAAGKERFDLAKLEQLLNRGPQAKREQGHREAYYISYRDVKTLAEYVVRLHANEPYEDSR